MGAAGPRGSAPIAPRKGSQRLTDAHVLRNGLAECLRNGLPLRRSHCIFANNNPHVAGPGRSSGGPGAGAQPGGTPPDGRQDGRWRRPDGTRGPAWRSASRGLPGSHAKTIGIRCVER